MTAVTAGSSDCGVARNRLVVGRIHSHRLADGLAACALVMRLGLADGFASLAHRNLVESKMAFVVAALQADIEVADMDLADSGLVV